MRVLSLFDGMSCGQLALRSAGLEYDEYAASEVDVHARQVTRRSFPDTIEIGDVREVRARRLTRSVDLLMGGSPCQGFSRAGVQLGFDDPRSALFYEFLRVRDEANPTFFLLENVRMSKADEERVTSYMGVEPIAICSSEITAGRRPRLYWTNIPFDRSSLRAVHSRPSELIDWTVTEPNSHSWHRWFEKNGETRLRKQHLVVLNTANKAACQTARQVANWNGNLVALDDGRYRFFTCEEAERLQTVPAGYTDCVSDSHRYKMLGNGWTVAVIAALLKGLK